MPLWPSTVVLICWSSTLCHCCGCSLITQDGTVDLGRGSIQFRVTGDSTCHFHHQGRTTTTASHDTMCVLHPTCSPPSTPLASLRSPLALCRVLRIPMLLLNSQSRVLSHVVRCLTARLMPILVGPTCSGKSTLYQLASSLLGNPALHIVPMTHGYDTVDLLGGFEQVSHCHSVGGGMGTVIQWGDSVWWCCRWKVLEDSLCGGIVSWWRP